MPDFDLENAPSGAVSIKVIGIGGGGCNAVDSVFTRGLPNVEFHVINSDLQALKRTKCPNRMQIGPELTKGRGCGADPKLGEQCMLDARETMIESLRDTEIVFLASGFGGGTGTGAAPVLAQFTRELGILTVGFVTTPFKFEGPKRQKACDEGLERMREHCDALIVINNNKLMDVVGPRVPLAEAFSVANNVLADAVQAISDLITTPCLINLDYNDVRATLGGQGGAVMGIGVGKGENRAQEAVKKAMSSPLLDNLNIEGATQVLVCVTGGPDLTLSEVQDAVTQVRELADPEANVIFGAGPGDSLGDQIRVMLIATGYRQDANMRREAEDSRRSAARANGHRNGGATHAAPKIPDINIPLFDEMDSAPAPAPVAAAPAPVAASSTSNPRTRGLRETLEQMMAQQDQGSLPFVTQPQAPAPAAGPSRTVQTPQARPASTDNYNVRAVPRPGAPSRPAVAQPTSQEMNHYDGEKVVAATEHRSGINFELPAFMRRRGVSE